MFAKLLLLFTVIPILELCVLIPLGQEIGTMYTIAIIVCTAVAGALLGKYQGASAWKRIKSQLETGQLPSDSILDGLAVVLASAFLVTPGILTDLAGFVLLIPMTRAPIRAIAKTRIEKWLNKEQVGLFGSSMNPFDVVEDPYVDTYGQYVDDTPHAHNSNVVIDVQATTVSSQSAQQEQPEVITIGQDA